MAATNKVSILQIDKINDSMKNKDKDKDKDNDYVLDFSGKELSKSYNYQSGTRNTKKPSKLRLGGIKLNNN